MAALSETHGGPVKLWLLILIACVGAWLGDNTAYVIGRHIPLEKIFRGERGGKVLARAHHLIHHAPACVDQLLSLHGRFERKRSSRGRRKVADGLSWDAVYCMRDVLRALDDVETMLDMADEDPSFAAEIPAALEQLEQQSEQLELQSLLNGQHDSAAAIITIYARDGGVDHPDELGFGFLVTNAILPALSGRFKLLITAIITSVRGRTQGCRF